MEFVAIDFEKLNNRQLSVCEVGLVVYKDGEEQLTFQSYINPVGGLERNNWAKEYLTHISDNTLLAAPTYKELFPKLREIIQDKVLVEHLKGADLNYIYNLEEHYNLPKLYSKWVDTNEIACSLGKKGGLAELYEQLFETPFEDHHKALEDARACGRIFECLSSQTDITRFVHEEEYLPSEKKKSYDDANRKHTQHGTANVSTDDLPLNHDQIKSPSYFQGKTVVLSGMTGPEKTKIKAVLDELKAKHPDSLSGNTDVFIIKKGSVGPSKKPMALKLQAEKGLLIITDEYFWELVEKSC